MVMSKYEETRLQRIEENKKRMEQLRLKSLARNLKSPPQSAKSSSKAKPPNRRIPEFNQVKRSGRNTGKPSPVYNESTQRDPSKIISSIKLNTNCSARIDHDQAIQRPSCLVNIDTHNFKNQLKLPAGVMNFFNGVEIPNEIVLRRKSSVKGKCWFVDLVKIDDDAYVLCNAGWTEFVRDSAVEFQDRILFEHNGGSQILFTVYDDESWMPKDMVSIPTIQNNVNVEQGEPKSNSDDDSDHEDEHSSSEEMSVDVNEKSDSVLGDVEVAPTESSVMSGKAWVKEVERAVASHSPHPFFVVFLSKSCIKSRTMRIPTAFGEKYLPTGRKELKLIIGSKSWNVVACGYHRKRVYWAIIKGWSRCAQGSRLREGDFCVFEVIDRDSPRMQVTVSVYRVSGDTLVKTDPLNMEQANEEDESVDDDSNEVEQTVARGRESGSIVDGKKWFNRVKNAFESEHPFFVIFILKSYLHGKQLYIPVEFARENLPNERNTQKIYKLNIKRSNGRNKSWEVGMTYFQSAGRRRSEYWAFMRGWKQCARGMRLQQGDICVFELIDIDGAKIQVSNFRVVDNILTEVIN